jgi:hypothetical protein
LWIASRPNAFGLVFLVGLIAGFFLGAHAVTGTNAAGSSMIGIAALGALVGFAAGRSRPPGPPSAPTLPAPRSPAPEAPAGPAAHNINDAREALIALDFSQRDAKAAIARAVSALGADATVSEIVREALRKDRP